MPKHPFAVGPVGAVGSGSETCSSAGSRVDVRGTKAGESDVAEGWRNEKVIYQCACVADLYVFFLLPFNKKKKLIRHSEPIELGNKKYRGLWFLPMVAGDLIEYVRRYSTCRTG